MIYDNPAARLIALLEQGKKRAPTDKCRAVWEDLLSAKGDGPLLMARLGKVMELSHLTIQSLKEHFPDQGNTWSHWESQLNTAFMVQNMHGHWETFISHIDGHTLTYLSMASALLQAKSNTKLLAESELSALREKLEALISEVLDSEQPTEVKQYIVRSLRRIVVSIEEYKLTGALQLLEAIDATFGHAAVDAKYRSFLTDTDLGKRLLDALGAMAGVVTVAVGLPQMTQAIALLAP